ncbi:hypothetical protein Tco_0649166 [Tanacetum coccineum]
MVAHTGSSSRTTTPYYVTYPPSVVDYDDDYQGDAVQTKYKDLLTSAMILIARAITQRFFNPTNNRLRTSSNTRNQATVQGDSEKGHYARNYLKPRVQDSKYFMEQMLLAKQDEAGVILTDEHNDFFFADASRIEENEEVSANICLMARIQPTHFDSDEGPSYDSAFLSEVETPSTSYVNPLFTKDTQEQNVSVEYDKNVQESYALEQLARNVYKEAEKQQIFAQNVQQQNIVLTKQLESQIVELQKTQSILKRKMSENDDKYHDIVLDLEVRAKKNKDVVLKMGNSLQGMFMLGPKPMSFYDSKVKHGLGYTNPYTLKKAISQNPKLYDASCLDLKVQMNVRDTEDILDDASKSQIKMKKKSQDPIAIEKLQKVKCSLGRFCSTKGIFC